MNAMTFLFLSALLVAPARALAGDASGAAEHFAKCTYDAAEKPHATNELVQGAFAAVGMQCPRDGFVAILRHGSAGWAFLGSAKVSGGGNPFIFAGIPANVASSLWKSWRATGTGQFTTPPTRPDILAVRKAAALSRTDDVVWVAVVGPWALVDVSLSADAEGTGLMHNQDGKWRMAQFEGGAFNGPLELSGFGVPYDIAQRLYRAPIWRR